VSYRKTCQTVRKRRRQSISLQLRPGIPVPERQTGMALESLVIRGSVLCKGEQSAKDFAFQFITDIRDSADFYEIAIAEEIRDDTMVFDKKTEVKHNYDDKVFAEINKVLKPWSFMELMSDNISALKETVQCGISGIWIGLRISALTNKIKKAACLI